MAHPQPAHTHFSKQGEGGESFERGGEVEHITEMGEGTGCLAYLLCFLPSTAAHTCLRVCICVHTALSHMHVEHVTSHGLHFTLL